MKILVAIKSVVDYGARLRVNANTGALDTEGAKRIINPFCEIALEEAIRLKEQGIATEVLVATIGAAQVQEQLRNALALGADRAIWVSALQELEPLAVAKCLHKLILRELPDLILLGKQAIDTDNNQVGQILAALCGYSQGTFVSHLQMAGKSVVVTREVDSGLQTLSLKLPAVITVDLRLNQPRFCTISNILKARQKPLMTITLEELGVDARPRLTILKIEMPAARKPGVKVANVTDLLSRLRDEAQVL